MNCANNCGEPVRLTEARDGIEMHDGKYEFEYVHEDGNPFCPIPCIAWPPPARTPSLTGHDRRTIARARELAALRGEDMIRAYLTGDGTMRPGASDAMVYPVAFGSVQWFLGELADLAERLAGP